jgi:hypothetical protein
MEHRKLDIEERRLQQMAHRDEACREEERRKERERTLFHKVRTWVTTTRVLPGVENGNRFGSANPPLLEPHLK